MDDIRGGYSLKNFTSIFDLGDMGVIQAKHLVQYSGRS